MQASSANRPRLWLVAQLVVIAARMAFMVYVILPSPGNKSIGEFLLVMGVLHMLFYKVTGRKTFAEMKSKSPFVANFWAWGGERGTQLLFLGIGIILAVAGCILIVVGFLQKAGR